MFFVPWKSSMRAQDLNMYHLPGLGVCLFYFLNCSQFLLLMYSNQLFFLTFDLLPPFILQFHPPPLATTYLFCVSMTLVICFYLYIREIILYFSFLIWGKKITSLSTISLRSIHVVWNVKTSLYFMAEQYFIIYIIYNICAYYICIYNIYAYKYA